MEKWALRGAAFTAGGWAVLYFLTHPGFALTWVVTMGLFWGAVALIVRHSKGSSPKSS